MRLVLLAVGVTFAAGSGFCQGTVNFNNRVASVLAAPVYFEGTPASGNAYSAVLLAAPGAGAPDDALAPAEPVTTFRTGSAAGYVAGVTATLGNVPKDAAVATIQMAAWENLDGTFIDWASAKLAWNSGFLRLGTSWKFNLSNIGGDVNSTPNLVGLQSFNVIGLFMFPAPSITAQPESRLAVQGDTVTFQVGASPSGPGEMRYLWTFNHNIIPGATSAQLTVTNVSAQNQGTYRAVVAGYSAPSSVSSNVVLKVISKPPELRVGPGFGGLEPDGLHFTLLSDPGLVCGLERSTDLLVWEGFLSVTNVSGELRLTNPAAATTPSSFCRAIGRLQ